MYMYIYYICLIRSPIWFTCCLYLLMQSESKQHNDFITNVSLEQ